MCRSFIQTVEVSHVFGWGKRGIVFPLPMISSCILLIIRLKILAQISIWICRSPSWTSSHLGSRSLQESLAFCLCCSNCFSARDAWRWTEVCANIVFVLLILYYCTCICFVWGYHWEISETPSCLQSKYATKCSNRLWSYVFFEVIKLLLVIALLWFSFKNE